MSAVPEISPSSPRLTASAPRTRSGVVDAGVLVCATLSDPGRLRALAEAGLGATADPRMEAIAERVRRRLSVPVALVSLVQHDAQVFPGAAGLPEPWASIRTTPLTHSFCRHVVTSAEPLVVPDAPAHPLVRDNLAVSDLGVRAYAGMPLTDEEGRVLGALCAIDVRPRDWDADELDALHDLADVCSTELRLRLVRFEAQLERARRDELEEQLRRSFSRVQTLLRHRTGVAQQLQEAMLTSLPEVPGLDMAACYHPADSREHVGGDWYDAAFVPDPRHPDVEVLAVCVGDVVGHTLQAVTVMGQVRPMLRQAAWDHPGEPPSHALTALELATEGLGLHATGTAVLAHLRRGEGGCWSMTWSNAGHPPPILVEPDGATVLLEGHDILFGYPALRPGPRGDHHRSLAPGATLFLYTDGLVERRGSDIDAGIERLRVLLAQHRDRPPAQIVDVAVDVLAPDAPDDVVAFAIHVGGR
jgi:serine phosphatase RsbU (regulator of sigma subunit)